MLHPRHKQVEDLVRSLRPLTVLPQHHRTSRADAWGLLLSPDNRATSGFSLLFPAHSRHLPSSAWKRADASGPQPRHPGGAPPASATSAPAPPRRLRSRSRSGGVRQEPRVPPAAPCSRCPAYTTPPVPSPGPLRRLPARPAAAHRLYPCRTCARPPGATAARSRSAPAAARRPPQPGPGRRRAAAGPRPPPPAAGARWPFPRGRCRWRRPGLSGRCVAGRGPAAPSPRSPPSRAASPPAPGAEAASGPGAAPLRPGPAAPLRPGPGPPGVAAVWCWRPAEAAALPRFPLRGCWRDAAPRPPGR